MEDYYYLLENGLLCCSEASRVFNRPYFSFPFGGKKVIIYQVGYGPCVKGTSGGVETEVLMQIYWRTV